jgi:transcriptional regulator with XRE-family HTH domain
MNSLSIPSDLGPSLKKAMVALELTQTQLGKKVGLSQSQVSRIVAGKIRRPPKVLDRICEVAKLPLSGSEKFDEQAFLDAVKALIRANPQKQVAIRRAFDAIHGLV